LRSFAAKVWPDRKNDREKFSRFSLALFSHSPLRARIGMFYAGWKRQVKRSVPGWYFCGVCLPSDIRNRIFVASEKIRSAKTWSEKWETVSGATGGGQSYTRRVRSKISEEADRFLKILRHQNDALRRNRMFREVAAYQTLDHAAIPKIVDTNVGEYEDLAYKLYLVTELIEGPTLEQMIENNGPLAPDITIGLVIRLLDIVEFCHSNDTIHRDIKPDNIILKSGDPARIFLVDFGLSFNKDDPPQHGTPSDEELGNRFCRLPELSASSRAKQDPRSDVTFCVGILLYAITGRIPALLADEEGRLPHQRTNIREALHAAVTPELLSRMLLIFDRGFQSTLSQRWQSADELRKQLKLLLEPMRNDSQHYEALRERVRAYTSQPHVQAATRVHTLIADALKLVMKVCNEIQTQEDGRFITNQTGHNTSSPNSGETMLALTSVASPRSLEHWIKFRAEVIGSEILLSASYRGSTSTLLRTGSENFVYDGEFETRVKRVFYKQMADVLG
jgi:eukaryotic-like serine/threonine-protein kinase